ncbi:MAG: YdeI/OmpD-associated family protein [Ferruginibacter sp.]
MYSFKATIAIIGINPFVFVPAPVLQKIFKDAGKERGHIPVHGAINNIPYKQTLVKYSGEWRLYINTAMLKASPKRIGEKIEVTIAFDAAERKEALHPKLSAALKQTPDAANVFKSLPASRQKEIARYINNLKTEASIDKNVARAIAFLCGRARFIGRDTP